MTALIREYQADGYRLRGAGVVVGSLIDPERIANTHIRIHACEGRLFRSVIEDAARRCGVAYVLWRERDLYSLATGRLGQSAEELRDMLKALGRGVAGSWRAEEKAAALAAWLVLASLAPATAKSERSIGE